MTDDLSVARHERSRLEYLDGLRGLGALSVVLYHFVVLLAPLLGADAVRDTAWATKGPLLLLTNGPFYVKVFFILSGYVLAESVASGRRPLASSFLSRYLRLTIPMTAALIGTWLIGVFLPHPPLPVFPPSLASALGEGFWGVYLHGAPAANFALWTMQFEFFGSLAIYAAYQAPPRYRMTVLLALAVLFLFRANGLGFAIGAILRELNQAGRLRKSGWGWLAGLGFVYFCCGGDLGIGLLHLGQGTLRAQHGFLAAIFLTAGAAALLYGVLTVAFWQSCLRTRVCQFLAHLSFGLYLIHFPLMYPMARLYPLLPGPTPFRLILLLILFVGSSLVLGWLLTVLIDDPLIRTLKRWRKGWLSRLTPAGFLSERNPK